MKKKYPATFFNKMSSMEFGFDLSHCKKKSVHQNAWNWSFSVDTKMFQTDFFLLTSEEFRLTIETLSEFEDWMSMTLMFYFFLNRKYPQFLFYNSFGKNIISKLYTSWLLTIATICYKVDGLGFWIIGKNQCW